MKNARRYFHILVCFVICTVMLLATACSSENDTAEDNKGEVLIPISINGNEIKVGETTVKTLLDDGLNVSWVDEDYNTVVVDPNTMLDANTYYTGGNIDVTDHLFFNISLVTGDEAVTLGDAVIARLELYMVNEDDKSVLETICFDGVPITELTIDKAKEMYPDWSGNEVMWLCYGLEYKYDLDFDISTGYLNKFAIECKYDVDWNGGK